MENEKRNPLDELFRRKLNEEQLVPDDSLWMEIEDQLEKILENKKGMVSDLATIEKKESELIAALQVKYGQGTINPDTGEITPVQ